LASKRPKIGVIGLGHWFERLSEGLSGSAISVTKAMGRKSFEERAERLAALGVTKSNYYTGFPDGTIPEDFFHDVEAVYVSSPNSLHYRQTIQTLEKSKYAIVEKTLATNEHDFNEIINFIRKNDYERMLYLHLHYLHKQLTLNMSGILADAVKDYGKVKGVSATFLEGYKEADKRRQWIFSMEEGGIFMDWMHPYEVLFYGSKAESAKLLDASLFVMNKDYGEKYPSGVEALSEVNGEYFEKDASAEIRIGKGSTEDVKRARFYFDDNISAEFNFLNSEEEFGSDKRGSWRLVRKKEGKTEVLKSDEPKGPDTSEIFASEIIELCNGKKVGLTVDEIKKLYGPQWDFQRLIGDKTPIADHEKVKEFIKKGSLNEVGGYTT
jgi:hypothetical protein